MIRCCENWKMTIWMVRYSGKVTFASVMIFFIAGLPRARSACGTEPHTHGIWSTFFRLVDPSRSSIFLKLSADKLLVFKWSQAQVQGFSKFIWNMLCLCATQLKFWLRTDPTSDAKIQPAVTCTGREDGCFWLFSPWSRVGHALRPIFMLWLVKIWQMSACGKSMEHLESCLLWPLKLIEFCVNLWWF